jgi:hypothetical protein
MPAVSRYKTLGFSRCGKKIWDTSTQASLLKDQAG